MKLTKLSKKDIAFIGYAVFEKDEVGDQSNILWTIGNRLEIDAVYGEGYDTTVFRACCAILGYDEPQVEGMATAQGRIVEALDNIGVNPSVLEMVQQENYSDAIAFLRGISLLNHEHDSYAAADTIVTILKQHGQEVEV